MLRLGSLLPGATSPGDAVPEDDDEALLVGADAAAVVEEAVAAAPAACSEAPLSAPQLLVYHCMTSCLSEDSVQEAAQMVSADVAEISRQADWQKQPQVDRSAVVWPPHAVSA